MLLGCDFSLSASPFEYHTVVRMIYGICITDNCEIWGWGSWKFSLRQNNEICNQKQKHYDRIKCYLCTRQRASWTYPPQVFTSVHLFNEIVRSGFAIDSPIFQNNWVKIHHRKNKVGWRFTKIIFFLGQDSL